MKHKGTVLLETERLILRKCQVSDYKESFLYCCSDEELARLQNFEVHENDQVTKKSFIEKENQYKIDNKFYEWAIINKDTQEFMGEIALVNLNEEEKSLELGYHLGKKFRGNGYMQEAIKEITKFAFEELECNLLYALILNDNLSSINCILKSNYKFAYTIPNYKDDVYEGPIDKYEMKKEDYFKTKEIKESNKRTRYIAKIFTLDRIQDSLDITTWSQEDILNSLSYYDKHYGLKLISQKEETLVIATYTNIIWNYKIYYGSYKKKYQELQEEDERWKKISKEIESDLKMIGLLELKEEVLAALQNNYYYEYKIKIDKQFKRYCIKD